MSGLAWPACPEGQEEDDRTSACKPSSKAKKSSYYGKTMSSKEVYFKYGVYRSFVSLSPKSKTVTTITYYDGVVRSKSKEGIFDPLSE